MKMTTKGLKLWLPVQLLIILTFILPWSLVAQGNLNAIIFYSGGAVFGNSTQGIGWSFVPTSDIWVTAINSTAPEVDFWLGTNQNIAIYNYAGPYQAGQHIFSASPPTNFQTIDPLFLSAGQTYFISTQQPNFSSPVNTFAYSLNGTNGLLPFNASPYISQFASYSLSSDGQWSSTTSPASENVNYVLLGPNFQFQAVPEPTAFELLLLSVGVLIFRRRAAANTFHVRQTP